MSLNDPKMTRILFLLYSLNSNVSIRLYYVQFVFEDKEIRLISVILLNTETLGLAIQMLFVEVFLCKSEMHVTGS